MRRVPTTCPCGLGAAYATCCGRFHRGGAAAPSAELLMRSRYSAFAVSDPAYLELTWHPATRPARVLLDRRQHWTRLEVTATEGGGLFADEGTVEFRAHWRSPGGPGVLRERSRFVRVDGRWLYVGPVS